MIEPQNAALLVPAARLDSGGVMAFSEDGRVMAIAGVDMISLYDVGPDSLQRSAILFPDSRVLEMAFSPDGEFLAVGDQAGFVTLWWVETGELGHRFQTGYGAVTMLAFRPDGSTLASGGYDSAIGLWGLPTGALIESEQEENLRGLGFSPDGRWLMAIGARELQLHAQDGSSSEILEFLEPDTSGAAMGGAFSPDSRTLAVAGFFTDRETQQALGVVRLWSMRNGQFHFDRQFEPSPRSPFESGYVRSLERVAISPDGGVLAAAGEAGLLLWDLETGELLSEILDRQGVVQSLNFISDGRRLALADSQRATTQWWEVAYEGEAPREDLRLQRPPLLGSDIVRLEERLVGLGYTEIVSVDGIFDEDDQAAVQRFQAVNGLDVNGEVDSATWSVVFGVSAQFATGVGLPNSLQAAYPSDQDVRALPDIWDAFEVTEELDLESPGEREFSVRVRPIERFLWSYFWCQPDWETLRMFEDTLAVGFSIDGLEVPAARIRRSTGSIRGQICHGWRTVVSGWEEGSDYRLKLRIRYSRLSWNGVRQIPAGDYSYTLLAQAATGVHSARPSQEEPANLPSIWDTYLLSDDMNLTHPGEREWGIEVVSDTPFIWPYSWCAVTPAVLAENLEQIDVRFLIDEFEVANDDVVEFRRELGNWTCHYWATKLTGWDVGLPVILRLEFEMEADLSDGAQNYPSGMYQFIIRVNEHAERVP